MDSNIKIPKSISSEKEFIPESFVVNVLIYDDKGRILLLKRKGEHTFYPDYWGVIMEKVKEGETFKEALHRGVYEEINLYVDENNVDQLDGDLFKVWKEKNYQIHRYFVGIGDSEIILNHEHDEYMWFDSNFHEDIDIMPDAMDMIEKFFERN